MKHTKWTGRALGAALLAGLLGGCDFIQSTTSDPNQVPNATVDQLFTAIQVNSYHITESQAARVASLWTQQGSGVNNQFVALEVYVFDEEEGDAQWASIYAGGGLVDIRRAIALAEEAGRRAYAGILKIHEAYFVGTAADTWGDVPYSEAANPDISTPKLDEQLAVYAAIQTRLDQAIADLAAGGAGPGSVDKNFAGNVARWTAVAHSLKARYYLHTAEVDNTAYAKALTEANLGIRTNAGNWRAIHSTTSTEQNLWFQFDRDRQDHIVGGFYLVNLLNAGTPANTADDDPRLAIYFTPATGGTFGGQYVGSKTGQTQAGDPETAASHLRVTSGSPAAADFNLPIISWSETAAIGAEAALKSGASAATQLAWYNELIAAQANFWGVTLTGKVPDYAALATDAARLNAIIQQKYIALFLSPELWNDYKRTCLPDITPAVGGQRVPARLFYAQSERQTNPNVPDVNAQPARNDNDPNPCKTG